MYLLNGWWFLSSSGSYPPVFMVASLGGVWELDSTLEEDSPGRWI